MTRPTYKFNKRQNPWNERPKKKEINIKKCRYCQTKLKKKDLTRIDKASGFLDLWYCKFCNELYIWDNLNGKEISIDGNYKKTIAQTLEGY